MNYEGCSPMRSSSRKMFGVISAVLIYELEGIWNVITKLNFGNIHNHKKNFYILPVKYIREDITSLKTVSRSIWGMYVLRCFESSCVPICVHLFWVSLNNFIYLLTFYSKSCIEFCCFYFFRIRCPHLLRESLIKLLTVILVSILILMVMTWISDILI